MIDKTTFFWVGLCGICHPGGGPGEFDRDDQPLYDVATGQFGYEALGLTAGDVALDGDYAFLNPGNGEVMPAAWNVTGVAEPDCLLCHRADRAINEGANMNWVWRTATLRGSAGLQDGSGGSTPAFAAAPTAAQGWFSQFELADTPPGKPPMATVVQVDYAPGIADGSLQVGTDGALSLDPDRIAPTPVDYACWGCHLTPDLKKRGRIWFDPDEDVHYAGFNGLTDADPGNDVGPLDSTACSRCHTADMNHNITKGNAFSGSVANHLDFVGFRTCRDCHDPDSPLRDPQAPAMSGDLHTAGHLAAMGCQTCHAPYKTLAADLVVDNSVTGNTVGYGTAAFLSADPLDPAVVDDSRWWPNLQSKADKDGIVKLFPAKTLLSIWWGDWDQNGTPGDMSDDVVAPIALWRVRGATGGAPLPVVTDDNADGVPEVNRPEEILAYLDLLSGNDRYGTPLATNPVLVKGGQLWYADPASPTGMSSVHFEGTGAAVESHHNFAIDHNVRDSSLALGAGGACGDCHFSTTTPVFDRLILVDPFDVDGQPVYETVRHLTGVSPF